MQKLISIIVPVFNVQPYLPECLQSIASQTYQNLEIVLVDDGSTDGSGEICDEWAERDLRFHVIHMENRGVAAARNVGLLNCTGDLIGFVDADDWIEKDMYMCLAKACQNADMAACGWIAYSEEFEELVSHGRKLLKTHDYEEAVIQVYRNDGYYTMVCNKLFRRKIIIHGERPVLFDQDLYIGEDELWLVKVMKNCGVFAFFPGMFYHYRLRIDSATHSYVDIEKRMTALLAKSRAIREIKDYERAAAYAKSGMYNEYVCLKIQSYIQGEEIKQERIHQEMRLLRTCWLTTTNYSKMYKLKVLLMELEMKLRLPAGLVKTTNNVKRHMCLKTKCLERLCK